MAEYIGGSEEAFVQKMNERAAALGMENTHFVDCCGLTDSDEHYTTPRDIAIMSRELLLNFPQVEQYTTIWMEDITHVTAKGSSAFGLTNTNKLLRSYDGCIGLKTGSTGKAKFCVSAAAKRGDITLISVIMQDRIRKSGLPMRRRCSTTDLESAGSTKMKSRRKPEKSK